MYKFSYIDRIRSKREGIEGFMGSRVHETLEKLYADLKYCKPDSEEELVAFYNSAWARNWHDCVFVVKEEYCADNYREMGEKCVREYYRHYHPFDDGRTLWLEQKVIIPLDPEGRYRLHEYIERMGDAIAAADVIVARAGATSIAEITAIGRASVLVPYPYATDDHQTLNARAVSAGGGAIVVPDDQIEGESFGSAVLGLVRNRTKRETMASAAAALGRPDAGVRVTEMVRAAAHTKKQQGDLS